MNTTHKGSKVHRCTECGNTYILTSMGPIGMAHPRRVNLCYNCDKGTSHPHSMEGTCPAHRRPLT